jgi:hypothetical protein
LVKVMSEIKIEAREHQLPKCPFCEKPGAVEYPDGEIICGNPECSAYPRIVSRKTSLFKREVKVI